MPTLSQCQILNSLIERRATEDNILPAEDANTENTSPFTVLGYPRSATPQPTYNGVIYTVDNNRPVSVGGKARNGHTDQEMSLYQKQRMQMVANTTHVLSAWRPKSLSSIEAAKIKSSSPEWNDRGIAYQRHNTYANFFPQVYSEETISSRAFYPWRRMASQKQLLIKPVLENFPLEHPSERIRNLPPSAPGTPVSAEPHYLKPENVTSGGVIQENKTSSKPTVQFTEPKKVRIVGDNENKDGEPKPAAGEETAVSTPVENDRVPARKGKLFMSCPDDVKDQLYQLGWRKPVKKRRKTNKKLDSTTKNPRLTYMTMPKLDLMKDPMLKKLAKKSKNVIVQAHPPEMRPRAVCFDIVGAHLTHVVVWNSIKRDILSEFEEVKIESIQYVPRSIFVPRQKNADPVENRWVITLANEWFRSRVTGMEIHFGEFTTTLRRFDDVVNLEYRQYTRMSDMMKMIKRKN